MVCVGDIAVIGRESSSLGQTMKVAIAGPAISSILLCIFGTLAIFLPSDSFIHQLTINLATLNLGLTFLNLLPGLPLDGVQEPKAQLWEIAIVSKDFVGQPIVAKFWQALRSTPELTLTVLSRQWSGF